MNDLGCDQFVKVTVTLPPTGQVRLCGRVPLSAGCNLCSWRVRTQCPGPGPTSSYISTHLPLQGSPQISKTYFLHKALPEFLRLHHRLSVFISSQVPGVTHRSPGTGLSENPCEAPGVDQVPGQSHSCSSHSCSVWEGSFLTSTLKLGKLRLRGGKPPPTCECQEPVSTVRGATG